MKYLFRTLLLLAAASMSATAICAQEAGTKKTEEAPAATTTPKPSSKDYQDLLAKLKGGDTSIDFTKLRMAFAETPEYSYSGADRDKLNSMSKLLQEKDFKKALKAATEILDKEYVNANAHFVAYQANKGLNDTTKADFHKAVLIGLLTAIKNGNDGLSAKTPFRPISIEEEYTIIKFLGYRVKSQSLKHDGGHSFDVFDVIDPKTNEPMKLYFDIDIIWAAENKLFSN